MTTMSEVAEQYLLKNGSAPFTKIWKHVFTTMKPQWKEQFPTKLLKDIEKSKIGELHTLLTVSGTFARLLNTEYVLAESLSYEEIKKLKINVESREE